MPETRLTAGATIDTLSAAELRDALKEWMVDAIKGIRPVSIATQGTADASGLIVLGGAAHPVGGTLGPEVGFWWAVQRLAVRVDGAPAPFSLYRNAPNVDSLVRDVPGEANGYAPFGPWELMLAGGDQLVIQTNSMTANTGLAIVSGQAVEIPNTLIWKWMAG